MIEPKQLTQNKVELRVSNLPEEFDGAKIIHLSDLHSARFGRKNSKLIDLITAAEPEYIFITGDCIDRGKRNGEPFLELLDGICGKCPIYYSLGNHESWIRERYKSVYDEYMGKVSSREISILDDGFTYIKRGNSKVRIYGLTPERKRYYKTVKMNQGIVSEKLGEVNESEFVILLAHEPSYFNEYIKWGANVIFSGHIHGGVIRLPFTGGIISPEGLSPAKYQSGVYKDKDSLMMVSRGLGTSHAPMRLFNKPEVIIITLKTA